MKSRLASLRHLPRRCTKLGVGLIVSAVALLAFATPAWAHHPVLTGATACTKYDFHYVVFQVADSEATQPMTITSATATVNGAPVALSGNGTVVQPGGKVTYTAAVPGDVTGTIVLTVMGSWSNGAKATSTLSIAFPVKCSATTTTTTSTTAPPETTTTTAPPETTTTTAPPETTTTTAPPETTTTTAPPETTTTTAPPETTTTTAPPETTTTTAPPETTTTTAPPETTTTTGDTTVTTGGVTTTTTAPPETTTTSGVSSETTSTTVGETTTTTDGTPITIGGSTTTVLGAGDTPTTGPNPPVHPLGNPATPATPPGSLPFTGNGTLLPMFGLGLFSVGAVLVSARERRSSTR